MPAIAHLVSIFFFSYAAQLAVASPLSKRSFFGDGTYYNPGVGLGSCGQVHQDSEFIVALNAPQMANGANPNHNHNCGRRIHVKGPKGSVFVTVTDTCPPCRFGSLDLSPAAFDRIANRAQGRVHITWDWA